MWPDIVTNTGRPLKSGSVFKFDRVVGLTTDVARPSHLHLLWYFISMMYMLYWNRQPNFSIEYVINRFSIWRRLNGSKEF